MSIVNALIGVVLLLFGRRLFWFFVAAAGFAAGMYVAHEHLRLQSDALVLAIALLAGVAGALLSLILQKFAIALAGFAVGALLGAGLVRALASEEYALIGFAVGGVIGAVLLVLAFEWALIILSSLFGASLLADPALFDEISPWVFIGALATGIIVQTLQRQRSPKTRRDAGERKRREK